MYKRKHQSWIQNIWVLGSSYFHSVKQLEVSTYHVPGTGGPKWTQGIQSGTGMLNRFDSHAVFKHWGGSSNYKDFETTHRVNWSDWLVMCATERVRSNMDLLPVVGGRCSCESRYLWCERHFTSGGDPGSLEQEWVTLPGAIREHFTENVTSELALKRMSRKGKKKNE